MSNRKSFLSQLVRQYAGSLLLVFLFNALSVLLTFCVYLLIEPFCFVVCGIAAGCLPRLHQSLHFHHPADCACHFALFPEVTFCLFDAVVYGHFTQ